MAAAEKLRYTPAEYLAYERASPIRHEYYQGELFAMSGASWWHNLIATNLSHALRSQLSAQTYKVCVSDLRVALHRGNHYVYPDVVVVCGAPEFLDGQLDTLLNPTVIVEILSESTEKYDRGLKFRSARRIPTLKDYVVISQSTVLVEQHSRNEGSWVLTEYEEPDAVLVLSSIDCRVPLREIYEGVAFDKPAGTEESNQG